MKISIFFHIKTPFFYSNIDFFILKMYHIYIVLQSKFSKENSTFMTRKEKAMQSFLEGYNCSQCMMIAFEDLLTIDLDTALEISSSFGGGMGRLREVCGSVSGMFMVLGFIYGYSTPGNHDEKKQLYAHIQELGRRYEEANGSIICRELLGLNVQHDTPTPADRTPEYYANRPCAAKIGSAAEILEAYLLELAQ